MHDFRADRGGVGAVEASTVVLVREREGGGLEVFCLARHPGLKTWGGAVVFPGGKVEEEDYAPEVAQVSTPLHARCADFGDSPEAQRAHAFAAARECLEEAGVMALVETDVSHARLASLRKQQQEKGRLHERLRHNCLVADLGQLIPFARWITPIGALRRFDTRFYVMSAPPGQQAYADGQEAVDGYWVCPRDMVDRFVNGVVDLVPPTLKTLELLMSVASIRDVSSLAGHQSLLPVCPEVVYDEGEVYLALPGDLSHSNRRRRFDGATKFALRNGRFVPISEDIVVGRRF